MGDAALFRLHRPSSGNLYLKVAGTAGLPALRTEAERTRWLSAMGACVPEILKAHEKPRTCALLMTAVPGVHPQNAERPREQVIRDLAQGLRKLHALPVAACPFDETVAARLARAQKMIEEGRVEPEQFAERNTGLTPEAIYRRLLQQTPAHEDIVVIHGDAKFDNILIDDDGRVGFVDCGHAGKGDRYVDLETVVSDIEEHFGQNWIAPFARFYGEPRLDAKKLRFFGDLYELF